jgi:hypothetical protein
LKLKNKKQVEVIIMEREIGEKKVVYKDGDYTKVLKGSCYFEDEFVKIETDAGPVWIGKSAIISIK